MASSRHAREPVEGLRFVGLVAMRLHRLDARDHLPDVTRVEFGVEPAAASPRDEAVGHEADGADGGQLAMGNQQHGEDGRDPEGSPARTPAPRP